MTKNEMLQTFTFTDLNDSPIVCALNAGLNDCLVPQLIEHSKSDPLILNNTRDAERFRDEQAYLKWREKNRKIYSLTSEDGSELLGIVWFGQEPLPHMQFELLEEIKPEEYGITIAKRLYGKQRGKGIAKEMMKAAFRQYLQDQEQDTHTGFWSETSADNERNIKVNEFFGFRRISKPNAKNKILMVASYEDLLTTLKLK